MITVKNKLPRATTPESIGVRSDVLTHFIKALDEKNMKMHSLMVVKDGCVAAECYWHPYIADAPMSMFSFSKGITSTAIGIAIDEGLLSLNDRIADYFPYKCKTKKDQERHEKLTVYDLITHRSGKQIPVIYDSEVNKWDEFWLSAPFKDEPGKKFSYISENTYMLSNLLTKITGQTVSEFLTPRLFEPLGIETPFWETDHNGNDAGGWGAFMTLEDIAKIGQLYAQNGMWNGKQLISQSWLSEATDIHVKKIPSLFQKNTGYGYQIFIQPERNTYSFNGLYGQFVVVYPEYNAVFACTSGECDEYTFIHTLNDFLPKAFSSTALPESGAYAGLKSLIFVEATPVLPWAVRNKKLENKLVGKKVKITGENPYASIIGPSTSFMLSKKSGNINDIGFEFKKDELTVSFNESNSENQTIAVGLAGKYLYSTIKLASIDFDIAAHATWTKNDELQLDIVPLGSAQKRTLTFKFRKNKVTIKAETNPGFYSLLNFYLMFNGINPILPLRAIVKLVSTYAEHTYNPNYKGVLE